jgi:hypothetical protein
MRIKFRSRRVGTAFPFRTTLLPGTKQQNNKRRTPGASEQKEREMLCFALFARPHGRRTWRAHSSFPAPNEEKKEGVGLLDKGTPPFCVSARREARADQKIMPLFPSDPPVHAVTLVHAYACMQAS